MSVLERWIRWGECGRNEENNYLVLMIGSLGGQGVPTICPFLSDRDKDKSKHFIHIFIYLIKYALTVVTGS